MAVRYVFFKIYAVEENGKRKNVSEHFPTDGDSFSLFRNMKKYEERKTYPLYYLVKFDESSKNSSSKEKIPISEDLYNKALTIYEKNKRTGFVSFFDLI